MRRRTSRLVALALLLPSTGLALDAARAKRDAIASLEALRATVDGPDRKRIDDAIAHVRASLTRPDGTPLFVGPDLIAPPPDGRAVFDEERRALDGLESVSTKKLPVGAAIALVASQLSGADQAVAGRAITIATGLVDAGAPAKNRLDHARDRLAHGDLERLAGRHKDAIQTYGEAWRDAWDAVAITNPPPTISDVIPPDGALLTVNTPVIGAVIESPLEYQTIDEASIVLTLDGIRVVDGSSGAGLAAVTIEAFGGRAVVAYRPSQPLSEGVHDVRLTASARPRGATGQARTTSVERAWTFQVDTVAPQLSSVPPNGAVVETETPTITLTFGDPPPGSGLQTGTLRVIVDGVDRTALFAVTEAGASWTVPDSLFLAQGGHAVDATILDRAGNRGSLHSAFTVDSRPSAFSIVIAPGPMTALVAGTTNDVTVRAVTSHGSTARGFVGLVRLTTTDPRSLLDNLILNLEAADQGSRTLHDVGVFLTAGEQRVQATCVDPALSGEAVVVVVPGAPAQLEFTAGGLDQRVLPGVAPGPFRVAIDDAFGNRRHDDGVDVVSTISRVESSATTVTTTLHVLTAGGGVADFASPLLAVGIYAVDVRVPAYPSVPPRTFQIQVVSPARGDVFLTLPYERLRPGATFESTLYLNVGPTGSDPSDPATALGAFDLCLRQDPTRLAAESVEIAADVGPVATAQISDQGMVLVSAISSGTQLRGTIPLFTVRYRVKDAVVEGPTPILVDVYDAITAQVVRPPVRIGEPTPRPSVSGSGLVTIAASDLPDAFGVVSVAPLGDSMGIATTGRFAISFSSPIDVDSARGSVTLVRGRDGAAVPADLSFEAGAQIVVLEPRAVLDAETRYVLTVSNALRSAGGGTLAASFAVNYVTVGLGDANDFDGDGRYTQADTFLIHHVFNTMELDPSGNNVWSRVRGPRSFNLLGPELAQTDYFLRAANVLHEPAPSPPMSDGKRCIIVEAGKMLPASEPIYADLMDSNGTVVQHFTEQTTPGFAWAGTKVRIPLAAASAASLRTGAYTIYVSDPFTVGIAINSPVQSVPLRATLTSDSDVWQRYEVVVEAGSDFTTPISEIFVDDVFIDPVTGFDGPHQLVWYQPISPPRSRVETVARVNNLNVSNPNPSIRREGRHKLIVTIGLAHGIDQEWTDRIPITMHTTPSVALEPQKTYLGVGDKVRIRSFDVGNLSDFIPKVSLFANSVELTHSLVPVTNEATFFQSSSFDMEIPAENLGTDGPVDVVAKYAAYQTISGTVFLQATHRYVLDRVPPSLSVTNAPLGVSTTNVVTFSGTWSDDTSGIDVSSSFVRFTDVSDPSRVIEVPATGDATTFSSTASLPDGTWRVLIEAHDLAGNATTVLREVTVDVNPPVASLTYDGAWRSDSRPAVRGTVVDLGTGVRIDGASFTLDGAAVSPITRIVPKGVSFDFTPPAPLSEGAHTFQVVGRDGVGSVTTATAILLVDTVSPSLPMNAAAGFQLASGEVLLSWLPATDASSGVDRYRVEMLVNGLATTLLETTQTSFALAAPRDDGASFRVSAIDRAGNVGRSAELRSCEAYSFDDLGSLVSTVLKVTVTDGAGAPVSTATVVERTTGLTLAPGDAPGVYVSTPRQIGIAVPLVLDVTVNFDSGGTSSSSGTLLPSPGVTDFGVLTVRRPGIVVSASVYGSGGLSSPGGAGATIGETAVGGPIAAEGSSVQARVGFWHTFGSVRAEFEWVPPIACGKYVPIYYRLSDDDAGAQDVTLELSTDGGIAFAPATSAGADGTVALASAVAGHRHVFLWDAARDLRAFSLADVVLRLSTLANPGQHDTAKLTYSREFNVQSITPTRNTTGVDPGGRVTLTFNRPVTTDLANAAASIQLRDAYTTALVPCATVVSANVVELRPDAPLSPYTWYSVVVLTTLEAAAPDFAFDQDPRQVGLQSFMSTFRAGGPSAAPPELVASTPTDDAIGVATTTRISLVFDKPLLASSVTDSSFTVLAASSAIAKTVELSSDGLAVTLTPDSALPEGRLVTVAVNPGVRSALGVPLGRFLAVHFVTAPHLGSPTTPAILAPAEAALVTTATPLITGRAEPLVAIRLVLNGAVTDMLAVSDANGDWLVRTYSLPDGLVKVQAVAEFLDGTSSGLSTVRSFSVAAAPAPPPPIGSDPHELVAGPEPPPVNGEPVDQVSLSFTGTHGTAFLVHVTPLHDTGVMGIGIPPIIYVNGLAGKQLTPGQTDYGAPGEFVFGGPSEPGTATVVFKASDAIGEGYEVSLVDPVSGANISGKHQIYLRGIEAVIVAPELISTEPTPIDIGLRGNIQRDRDLRGIVPIRKRRILLQALDDRDQVVPEVLFSDPSNPAEGEVPGEIALTADEEGNVALTVRTLPSIATGAGNPFRLEVTDLGAYAVTANKCDGSAAGNFGISKFPFYSVPRGESSFANVGNGITINAATPANYYITGSVTAVYRSGVSYSSCSLIVNGTTVFSGAPGTSEASAGWEPGFDISLGEPLKSHAFGPTVVFLNSGPNSVFIRLAGTLLDPNSDAREVSAGANGALSCSAVPQSKRPKIGRKAFKRPDGARAEDDQAEPEINPNEDDGSAPLDGKPCGLTDPVYWNNGQMVLERTDLAVPGRGGASGDPAGDRVSWSFRRCLKSYVLYDGPLGHGWTHNYDMRVVRDGTFVSWLTGTNREVTFTLGADGRATSPTGIFERLLGDDGEYVICTPNKMRYHFRSLGDSIAPGALASIVDRHGDSLRFDYGTSGAASGKLVRATDCLDRVYLYEYDLNGRLKTVQDFSGRTVTFKYSLRGDLVKVTGPAFVDGTEGEPLLPEQQWPSGRSEIYYYSRGWADERLNHKLLLIVAPNEAQSVDDASLDDFDKLRPLSRIENTWYLDPSDPVTYGRLASQRWGGTNATGVPAGGTVTAEYAVVTPSGLDPLNDEVFLAKVKDRNGNRKDFFHNRAGQCVRTLEYANRNVRPRGSVPGTDPEYFETRHTYNRDGMRLSTRHPLGNTETVTYDESNVDRGAQRNPLIRTWTPDSRGDSRGGMQPRTIRYAYEPIYNQLRALTDERGNDPTYVPQNGGANSPGRYTTVSFFDYQQSPDTAAVYSALSVETGLDVATVRSMLDASGVALGLGSLNGDTAFSIHGDVVKVQSPTAILPDGTRQESATTTQYNAHGLPTRAVDPEGFVHTFSYYPVTNPTGSHPVTSQSSEDGGGYLASTVTDAANLRITTRRRYDSIGDVIRVVDGRGIEHESVYDPLGELVRTKAAASTSGAFLPQDRALEAPGYETVFVHDANGNVIERRQGNQGERTGSGEFSTNRYWTTKQRFDILDDPIAVIQEVEPIQDDASISETSPGALVTTLRYDPNTNRALIVKPEGNVVATAFDERDLPFTITRAYGTDLAATTKRHYDLNGNVLVSVDATKNNRGKNPEFPEGDVWTFQYDGFDRQLCVEDPESNCGDTVYDPANGRIRFVKYGPDEEGRPRLAEFSWLHDELGRVFQENQSVFTYTLETTARPFERSIPTTATAPPPGEQFAMTKTTFDRLSRPVRVVTPKGDELACDYDGAGRVVHTIGAAFSDRSGSNPVHNEVRSFYDGESNLLRTVETERSPVVSGLEETYTTDYVHDAVGRPIRVTDPVGQTSRCVYDSRSNRIVATDAKSSRTIPDPLQLRPGLINDHGNVVRTFYDGLSRPVRVEKLLKRGGVGDGSLEDTNLDSSNPASPTGIVVTRAAWDRNSRVIARTDANGNVTGFHYDALERCDVETFADATATVRRYDLDDNLIQATDPNGTVVQRTYDGAHRLTRLDVTKRATGIGGLADQDVVGTTLQAFEWDGLSRLRGAIDDNGDATTLGTAVERTYDSLSRVLSVRQRIGTTVGANAVSTTNGRLTISNGSRVDKTVVSGYEAPGGATDARIFPRTRLVYPTSGRTIAFGFDGLDRIQTIADQAAPSQPLAAFEFVGGRTKTRTLANGTETTFHYDGARRVDRIEHRYQSGGATFAGFAYAYDGASQRTSEQVLHATPQSKAFTYDSLYRITNVSFGDGTQTSYELDGANNFTKRVERGVSTIFNTRTNGRYSFDALNGIWQTDEYDPAGALVRRDQPKHDAAGATVRTGDLRLSFDALDRLSRVDRALAADVWVTVGSYTYDALGRRTTKRAIFHDASGVLVGGEETAYICDGAREIEEVALGTGALVADYVYGAGYVDELVQGRRFDGSQPSAFYYHQNASFDVAALTDGAGAVLETYDYRSIYGVCRAQPTGQEIRNALRFQGRRWDQESGLYYFRARHLDPEKCRFVTRDPRGMWSDGAAQGNAYAFSGANPVNYLDPAGLRASFSDFLMASSKDAVCVFKDWLKGVGEGIVQGIKNIGWSIAHPIQFLEGVRDWWNDFSGKSLIPGSGIDLTSPQNPAAGGDVGEAALGMAATLQLTELKAITAAGQGLMELGGFVATTAVLGMQISVGSLASEFSESAAGRSAGRAQSYARAAEGEGSRFGGRPLRVLNNECFLAGTLVVTDSGKRPIEDVREGDLVWSRDADTGEEGLSPVTRLFPGVTSEVCTVTLRRASRHPKTPLSAGEASDSDEPPPARDSIRCTRDHPFFVEGRGWTGAASLERGDLLVGVGGVPVAVESVRVECAEARTYNFEVEGRHTYFVAAGQDAPAVWVHNVCGVTVLKDASGRVTSAAAAITKADIGAGTSTNAATRAAARALGSATDDAGHLVGKLLGGPGGKQAENFFAQNPAINRGAFRQLERQLADEVLAGRSVDVKVTLRYPTTGKVTRPSGVVYEAWVDGAHQRHIFGN